ncbi:MAG: riboflavin kinase [bacterium]|nr:riboflavin kinase [bacterium]
MNHTITFTASAISGAGRGKNMGVPTINVNLASVPEELTDGIYAAIVSIDDSRYSAAMHYGPRPVFDDSRACEVHLLDVTLYDAPSNVTIEVVERIRDIEDFPSTAQLIAKIQDDIGRCRGILKAYASQS